jgi:ABC-type antimicrobial peptide transport system permease subunit
MLTLVLGIGANAAIFTLVRGVLLRPLVNRDEERLIYKRQSVPGIGADNAALSVPDLRMPGVVPVAGSAIILLAAAVVASVLPAARAARVDVMQALHSD